MLSKFICKGYRAALMGGRAGGGNKYRERKNFLKDYIIYVISIDLFKQLGYVSPKTSH